MEESLSSLAAALAATGVKDVDQSSLAKSLYSSDASLYRVAPILVVRPRHVDELASVLGVCQAHDVSLTMRGAGTSIAGNAVGEGVVVDVSKYLNKIVEIDAESRTALVEPGVIQAQLQRAAAPHGLRFGPDPSTHNRATIGGMIGNNACGSRALGYGRTSDNVVGLDLLTGDGTQMSVGHTGGGPADVPGQGGILLDELRALVGDHLEIIRTKLGQFSRQVSGYSLEHLLPERGFDVARALVGSEGTLALTCMARLRLVEEPPARLLIALGYPSIAEAADDVPRILPFGPTACEGLDSRIVGAVRAQRGVNAVPAMPRGAAWLLVELAGASLSQLESEARALIREAATLEGLVISDPRHAAAIWRIREDGAGLSARTTAGKQAHAGWEDAAVRPEHLGAYLRQFDALMDEFGLSGMPYGHFGDGCVHIRIDFPLDTAGGTKVFREFLEAAARLTVDHGGSLSGEHGDGRARSELLPLMYSPEVLDLFARVKAMFDPKDLLNPGVIVRPAPLDENIRATLAVTAPRRSLLAPAFGYTADSGDLTKAVHRCTGVGKCLASSPGTVMCPSYQATRDEKDSTRGRARVLQDVVTGKLGPNGFRSQALHDALDLCLSCKGCASDCPTGVDMATYKAEALHERYRRRIRPRAHYSLGWLPRWARLVHASRWLPTVTNRMLSAPWAHSFIAWAAGVDARRDLPAFATTPFRALWDRREEQVGALALPEVVLFADTFTNAFDPEVAVAAVSVLERAGYRVSVPPRGVCCGLTWISTGQLDGARRQMRATAKALEPFVDRGMAIVGLEPSCTAVLRSELPELLRDEDSQLAQRIAAQVRTLAEVLMETSGWQPPDLSKVHGLAQPHCHHHAVLGWDPDEALLRQAGATIQKLDGCCGLAGNFGAERGHHDISVQVANLHLVPALDQQPPDATVLADGFSCRTQLKFLGEARGQHLAELLANALVE